MIEFRVAMAKYDAGQTASYLKSEVSNSFFMINALG